MQKWTDVRDLQVLYPLLANASILYTLKAPENERAFGVSRGYKIRALTINGLKTIDINLHLQKNDHPKNHITLFANFLL